MGLLFRLAPLTVCQFTLIVYLKLTSHFRCHVRDVSLDSRARNPVRDCCGINSHRRTFIPEGARCNDFFVQRLLVRWSYHCCRRDVWDIRHEEQLELEDPQSSSSGAQSPSDLFCLFHPGITSVGKRLLAGLIIRLIGQRSWLISKGRRDDAFDILVKYHAEGDRESEFVKAEFAQIESTLKIEQENANRGWKELFATPGMRRRVIIASFLGLFTQWSGNGMIS